MRGGRNGTCVALVATLLACGGGDAPAASEQAAESTATSPPPAVQSADTTARETGAASTVEPERPPQRQGSAGGGDSTTAPTPSGQIDVPRLLRQTSQAYSGMQTLRAQFSMNTANPLLPSGVASRGMLYQRRPDRILLRFEEPAGDLILGDGRYFWIYYPSTDPQQVIRATAAQDAAGGVDLWAQFVGDPVARFDHTFNATETLNGRETAAVTLVPRTDLGYERLKVWIDTRDFLVRKFEVTEHNGTNRRIELRELQINPALPDSLFRFVPPAGVRVIER